MKPPAFQFYADDFLGGTMTMNHEERGLYIMLLCLQWTQDGIKPSDVDRLAKGMAQPSISHVLGKFKKNGDGTLKNERLEVERHKQANFRKNRSESGKSGAFSRWHSHSTAIAQPMTKNGSPSPSPFPSVKLSKGEKLLRSRVEDALGIQFENDAGKWVNRIKENHRKSDRVIAEVESAIKEHRIKTTPAQYAEQIWKEFK